jgi:hypothetical protein
VAGLGTNEVIDAAVKRLQQGKHNDECNIHLGEGGVLIIVSRGEVAGELLAKVLEEVERRGDEP